MKLRRLCLFLGWWFSFMFHLFFFFFLFPFLFLFCFFCVAYVGSMAFRSVLVVKVVCNWHWPHQGACLFTFGCFCCCVGLPFFLLGLPFCFVIIFLQVACPFCGLPGLGLVTVSRLTLCSYVPCFVAFIFRWARGARVSSGLSPFLGWIVCVVCPVAVAIV